MLVADGSIVRLNGVEPPFLDTYARRCVYALVSRSFEQLHEARVNLFPDGEWTCEVELRVDDLPLQSVSGRGADQKAAIEHALDAMGRAIVRACRASRA